MPLYWIRKASVDTDKGIVEIRLDNDMKPFLLEIKQDLIKRGLFDFSKMDFKK